MSADSFSPSPYVRIYFVSKCPVRPEYSSEPSFNNRNHSFKKRFCSSLRCKVLMLHKREGGGQGQIKPKLPSFRTVQTMVALPFKSF